MATGCSVVTATLVYAWPTKSEFDALAIPEMIHDWKPDRTETVIRNDGQEWERQCHSKMIQADGVKVIFQWFEARPVAVNRNQVEG